MYVKFGSAKDVPITGKDQVIRVYFDRHGFVYPACVISDTKLRSSDARLGCYYQNYRSEYEQICLRYGVAPYTGDLNLIKPKDDPLQEALVIGYTDSINAIARDRELVFIIHGYNESPVLPKKKSSVIENQITRDSISKAYPERSFLFVEIYWDGLSADQGTKAMMPFNSIYIWGFSQVSATYVALELRRFFTKLHSDKINVITHSHGAGVITTALFNVKKFTESLYTDPCSWLYDINQRYNDPVYNTPVQQYYIGMLAPAIPGTNVFDRYYYRTENGRDAIYNHKNYHFVIGFNQNDRVTSKFGLDPKKIGSTSLACLPDELAKTKALFNNNLSIINDEDFSRYGKRKQRAHSWLKYMKNQPHFNNFLNKVFMPIPDL